MGTDDMCTFIAHGQIFGLILFIYYKLNGIDLLHIICFFAHVFVGQKCSFCYFRCIDYTVSSAYTACMIH